ncbi:MAG: Sec-independent protein translocase protein TatB [Parvularculales bacterium]
MFDIGWLELLTLAVLAILVVGPKDLPRLMRGVGRFVARAKAMARQFQAEFDDMARATDLEGLSQDVKGFAPPPLIGEERRMELPPKDMPSEEPVIYKKNNESEGEQ